MTAVEIRPTTLEDWPAYREVRLRALAEAPYAFGSTLDGELAFGEEVWRERAASGRNLLARDGVTTLGLIATIVDGGRDDERHLVSMWVAPEVRGTGLGRRLVEAAVHRAAADGARRVTLYVTAGNPRAREFYEHLGFRPTGERKVAPGDPCHDEELLALDLT